MKHRIEYKDQAPTEQPRTVRRFDRAPLEAPQLTSEGFMRAQGLITRCGVFEYLVKSDGDQVVQIRELRPPDEVFAPESLGSFGLVPMTLDHPPENLTPDTVKEYQVGSVGVPEPVGDQVRADLMITDQSAIEAVQRGKNQLSCGYVCKTIFRPGWYTDASGERFEFDCIQTQIRGNHVAIVDQARAGSTAAIRLDAGDGVVAYTETKSRKDQKTMLIKVNDKEYEVPDEVGQKMQELEAKAQGGQNADEGDAGTEDKAEGKIESKDQGEEGMVMVPEEKLVAMEGRLAALEAAAQNRDKRDAADRLAALKVEAARLIEVDQTKFDGQTELEIRKAVIAKLLPSMRLDNDSKTYIEAVYQTAVSLQPDASDRFDTSNQIRDAVQNAMDEGGKRRDGDKDPGQVAWERSVARMNNAWKPPSQRAAENRAK